MINNPALMNYLQSQQGDDGSQMNAQEQQQYNPFDQGIKKAIESARESLGMTDKQQDKALRRSMLTFANNIAQQPKEKGFFNNFGSVARALSPAIMEHDNYEEAALSQNNALANQILSYRAAEEAKLAKAEEQAWRRQYAESQLGEQRRYHDMMGNFRQRQPNAAPEINPYENAGFIPFPDKRAKVAYQKDQKALGTVLHEISELEKSYGAFRGKYKDNLIDPMSAIGSVANVGKDFFGKWANNKALREESADRKSLNSQLNKFVISSERALKGGGVMGPTLIKLFEQQGIYPNLEHDTPEIFESKLKMLKDELANNYKAADLSLRHGVQLNPSNLEEFEARMSPSSMEEIEVMGDPDVQMDIIQMQDPNGKIYSIPVDEVSEAIDLGLTAIE